MYASTLLTRIWHSWPSGYAAPLAMDADNAPQVFTPFSDVSFEDLASTDPLKQIPALHKLIYEQCNGKECSYYIDTLHKVRTDAKRTNQNRQNVRFHMPPSVQDFNALSTEN